MYEHVCCVCRVLTFHGVVISEAGHSFLLRYPTGIWLHSLQYEFSFFASQPASTTSPHCVLDASNLSSTSPVSCLASSTISSACPSLSSPLLPALSSSASDLVPTLPLLRVRTQSPLWAQEEFDSEVHAAGCVCFLLLL